MDEKDRDLFNKILEVDEQFRCYQSTEGEWDLPLGRLLLGVPPSEFFGWAKYTGTEILPTAIQFYIGASHPELFKAYALSSYPKQVVDLFVGSSTYDYYPSVVGDQSNNKLDFSEITQFLAQATYPKLTTFSLGETELFCNADGIFGAVGDLTPLLSKMPNIEKLTIGGSFQLSEPLSSHALKVIRIRVVGCVEVSASREPSLATFNYLLASELPALSELCIDFNCDGGFLRGSYYSFDDKFLSGVQFPGLDSLEVGGLFKRGEISKLKSSVAWNKCSKKYCNATEAYYLAVDVHYENSMAFICGVAFSDPGQSEPDEIYYSEVEFPGEYESGQFYKRELPCVLKLLEQHDLHPAVIIVDGFVYLDESNSYGMGARLSQALSQEGAEVAVIGVAKNPRKDTPANWGVLRGESAKPLYVTSIGLGREYACDLLTKMSGKHRIPTLLKSVDRLCRSRAADAQSSDNADE